MKIVENKNVKNTKLTIVCCLHGDEVFGKKVFDHFQKQINVFPGLRLVLANEQAFKKGVRFIDSDLNRSFPGKTDGNHEEKLAIEILELVKNDEYVLDIHTTTSNIRVTPIITNFNKGIGKVLNLSSSTEIVFIERGKNSLIGNVGSGVSLEFGEKFALTHEAFEEIRTIVDCLFDNSRKRAVSRRLFYMTGTISLDITLPKNAKNFRKIDSLGYPFLLGERAYYKEHKGFIAEKFEVKKI